MAIAVTLLLIFVRCDCVHASREEFHLIYGCIFERIVSQPIHLIEIYNHRPYQQTMVVFRF